MHSNLGSSFIDFAGVARFVSESIDVYKIMHLTNDIYHLSES